MRLTLVGTGHVFKIGPAVEQLVASRAPHAVCVELDPVRLAALKERVRLAELEAAGDPRAAAIRLQHEQAMKRLPLMYRFLARLQERLAGKEGVEAGSEMLAAVTAAERLGVPVATIDVDAQNLIRRAWREMRWGERFRFLWAMLRGQRGHQVDTEMERYQDDPVAYLAEVGSEFPGLKRVLIDERDAHMARALIALREHGLAAFRTAGAAAAGEPPTQDAGDLRVVAVVGDGHVPGILGHLLEHYTPEELEVVRVGDLRAASATEAMEFQGAQQAGDTASVSLRVDVPGLELPSDEA